MIINDAGENRQSFSGRRPAGETGRAMIDGYNRKISYLRISVTDRCNLRCIYCLHSGLSGHTSAREILSFEELREVIKAAVGLGINKFRITGGEPLLRKGIAGFIGSLKDIPGIKDLSLTTNGMLLKKYAKKLFAAGLRRINISIDTLNEKKFAKITKGGSLKKVLAGTEAALSAGFSPVKINTVIIRGLNDDEISDFAGLCRERPLHIRFIELMPTCPGDTGYLKNIVPAGEIKNICARLGKLDEIKTGASPGPARIYSIAGWKGRLGFITPVTMPFCSRCNRLRLTAAGMLKPCLDNPSGINLLPALRPKINRDGIKELFIKAVETKPKRHKMSISGKKSGCLEMSKIGG